MLIVPTKKKLTMGDTNIKRRNRLIYIYRTNTGYLEFDNTSYNMKDPYSILIINMSHRHGSGINPKMSKYDDVTQIQRYTGYIENPIFTDENKKQRYNGNAKIYIDNMVYTVESMDDFSGVTDAHSFYREYVMGIDNKRYIHHNNRLFLTDPRFYSEEDYSLENINDIGEIIELESSYEYTNSDLYPEDKPRNGDPLNPIDASPPSFVELGCKRDIELRDLLDNTTKIYFDDRSHESSSDVYDTSFDGDKETMWLLFSDLETILLPFDLYSMTMGVSFKKGFNIIDVSLIDYYANAPHKKEMMEHFLYGVLDDWYGEVFRPLIQSTSRINGKEDFYILINYSLFGITYKIIKPEILKTEQPVQFCYGTLVELGIDNVLSKL